MKSDRKHCEVKAGGSQWDWSNMNTNTKTNTKKREKLQKIWVKWKSDGKHSGAAEAGGSQWAGQPPHSVSDLHWGVRASTTMCMHIAHCKQTQIQIHIYKYKYIQKYWTAPLTLYLIKTEVTVQLLLCVLPLSTKWVSLMGADWAGPYFLDVVSVHVVRPRELGLGSNMMWDNFAVFSFWVHFKRPGM